MTRSLSIVLTLGVLPTAASARRRGGGGNGGGDPLQYLEPYLPYLLWGMGIVVVLVVLRALLVLMRPPQYLSARRTGSRPKR